MLTGPTGSGKTDLAVALAEHLPVEVINADSRQIYRGLDVGTAKPSAAQLERVPHHLYDLAPPNEQVTLGAWLPRAREAIAAITDRGAVPVVVGGPGLYLASLVLGYAPPPPGDPRVRAELERRLLAEGPTTLVTELHRRDPDAKNIVDTNNPRRVVRALEVVITTNKPFSTQGRRAQPYAGAVVVAIEMEAQVLHARLRHRAEAMFGGPIEQETAAVLASGCSPDAPGLSGIGYPQTIELLAHRLSLADAVDSTVKATRVLVRRQRNWLNRLSPSLVLDGTGPVEDNAQLVAGRWRRTSRPLVS